MKLITYSKISKLVILSLLLVSINSLATKKIENELTIESENAGSSVFQFMENLELNKLANATTTNGNNSQASGPNKTSSYVLDLKDPEVLLEEWMSISSAAFSNPKKYPTLKNAKGQTFKIKFGGDKQRVNDQFDIAQTEGSVSELEFWFKVRGGYIYYSSSKQDKNILGAVLVERIKNIDSKTNSEASKSSISCFNVWDPSNDKYEICAHDNEKKLKWLCSLQNFLEEPLEWQCDPNGARKSKANVEVEIEVKKVTQPIVIIPVASKMCNDKWNYINRGNDWECTCAEGKEQSPIDLPPKDETEESPLKPVFQYEVIHAKATESTMDGTVIAGEYIKIRHDRNAIRIHHHNMGRIVAFDGGVFQAEEIVFHTPSEHTIEGKIFDMEMQVIHYGKSKGDIAKQIVLSFLFKSKPGKYNKFMEKLDFFNLPNPVDTFRDITNDLFLPNIFYSVEDDDVPAMTPFSFYTYKGSLTSPPCTERTTHYIASDPIEISGTVVQLFKEALRDPDNKMGEQYVDNSLDGGLLQNARSAQPKNGRAVFLYNHVKFCPEFKKPSKSQKRITIKNYGHYEKREISATEYVYVNGQKPSGLPGSFVISENEAKGNDIIPEDKQIMKDIPS